MRRACFAASFPGCNYQMETVGWFYDSWMLGWCRVRLANGDWSFGSRIARFVSFISLQFFSWIFQFLTSPIFEGLNILIMKYIFLYYYVFHKLCVKIFVKIVTHVFLLGIIAEEVLYACDENTIAAAGGSAAGGELGLANPAVHFFR